MAEIAQDVAPVSLGLTYKYSPSLTNDNLLQFKAIPRDSTGAILDCTNLVSLSMEVALPGNFGSPATPTVTMGTADNTGVIGSLSAAQVASVYSALGANTFQYTLFGVGATKSNVIAYGTFALTLVP